MFSMLRLRDTSLGLPLQPKDVTPRPIAKPGKREANASQSYPGKSASSSPHHARKEIMRLFDEDQPKPNGNRSGVAKSLTFGAQTGRGSNNGCVIKRTLGQRYVKLFCWPIHMAQSVVDNALPYLGFQILKLEKGQVLNQHRDYHNHPDYPNHTMKFGIARAVHCRCCETECGIPMISTMCGCPLMH